MATAKKSTNGNGKPKTNGNSKTNGKGNTKPTGKTNGKIKSGKKSTAKKHTANQGSQQRGIIPYRWKPGQSGNPAGPPRGTRVSDILKDILESNKVDVILTNEKGVKKEIHLHSDVSMGRAICIAQVCKAWTGDTQAFNAIVDRVEGKPSQSFVTGASGAPEGSQKWLVGGREIVF